MYKCRQCGRDYELPDNDKYLFVCSDECIRQRERAKSWAKWRENLGVLGGFVLVMRVHLRTYLLGYMGGGYYVGRYCVRHRFVGAGQDINSP